jgi:MFS family permease
MSATQPVAARPAWAASAPAGDRRNLGLALVVIATAQLMVVLDATIVNVALPHIQHALGFSGSVLEWVVNAYAVTFGGLLLLGGRTGDLLGRRRVFIAGLVLFSTASLAGGFATSQAWLLAARAVQGAGGALVAPAALALIVTTFAEGPARNRAMGVYAAMSGGGAAVGLVAGGLLTTYLSWRWVLFVNVPIGVLVAAAAPFVLAGSGRRRGRFDLPGAVAGTGGVALLVYGLSNASADPRGVSRGRPVRPLPRRRPGAYLDLPPRPRGGDHPRVPGRIRDRAGRPGYRGRHHPDLARGPHQPGTGPVAAGQR